MSADSISLRAMERGRGISQASMNPPITGDSIANLEIQDQFATGSQPERQSLPPTDRGRLAWLVLAGCCALQTSVWGFPLASGVLQSYYLSHSDELEGDISNVAIIGTTNTGILYLSSPIIFTILSRWPRLRPSCGPIGLLIMIASLIASTFTNNVAALVATQGALQAIGSGLLFAPTTLYLDEWFVQRRGLAYGILWSGKSLVGVVLPLAMQPSLERFGYRTVLRAWAIFAAVSTAPLLHFLRPRIPVSRNTAPRKLDLSFFRMPTFWILGAGNMLQSLGYFLPTAYLTSYATDIGLSPTAATLLLALLNGVSVIGSAVFGPLTDRYSVGTVILIVAVGSALSVFLLWGLATRLVVLVFFAMGYGFFAGSFSSTWSGVLTELQNEAPSLDTGLVFGLLAGGRGIGNVISGPLSVALMAHAGSNGQGKAWGYSTQYGPVIIFTGVTAVLGGLGWVRNVVKMSM